MKLIPRRKKDPTPLEQGLTIFSKVFKALAAVRVARGALKGYRFAKRLPLLIGGGVAALFAARKLRGSSSDAPSATSSMPTPPPAPSKPGATDDKSRAEAAVATSAGLADAETAAGGENGATDEDAGEKPA